MRGNVLVLAEHNGQAWDPVTFQLLHVGRELAEQTGTAVDLLIFGHEVSHLVEQVMPRGAHRVFLLDHPAFAQYSPELFSKAFREAVQELHPGLVLLGYTPMGMEVGPAVATWLGLPMVSNCLELLLGRDGALRVRRPVFGQRWHELVELPPNGPIVVSMARAAPPSVFYAPATVATTLPIAPESLEVRTRALEVMPPQRGALSLATADIVVSVGRGIGSPENLPLVEELAQVLGAALGCSRPLVDMGWLPPEHQVGESGTTVRPKVYVACGISGAYQHLVGIREAQTIIAINRDPSAPIFRVADYGVVGDLLEVLPVLLDEARRRWPLAGRRESR